MKHNEKAEIFVLIFSIIVLIVFGTAVLARNNDAINSVYHSEMTEHSDYTNTAKERAETHPCVTASEETEAVTETEPAEVTAAAVTKAPEPVETTSAPVITSAPVTETPTDDKYLGTFIITGYYAAEGKSGECSATGVPLVPWKTCAMNVTQIKTLGLHYGDFITVEGIGTFRLIDNGCEPDKVDIFVNCKSEAYAVTDLTKTRKVWVG